MDTQHVNLRKELLKVAPLFLAVMAVQHTVFGQWWNKEGLFFKGVASEKAYLEEMEVRLAGGVQFRGQHIAARLSPDGSAVLVSDTFCEFTGEGSVASFDFGCEPGITKILDDTGRPLGCDFAGKDGLRRVSVHFRTPAKAVRRFVVRLRSRNPNQAVKRGDEWVYTFRQVFGGGIRFRHTAFLPPGARIISAEPKPGDVRSSERAPTVTYLADLRPGQKFECTIRYVLR